MTDKSPFHEQNPRQSSKRRSIQQRVGRNNQGNFQAVNAGRDAHVTQKGHIYINRQKSFLIHSLFEWLFQFINSPECDYEIIFWMFLLTCLSVARLADISLFPLAFTCEWMKAFVTGLYIGFVYPIASLLLVLIWLILLFLFIPHLLKIFNLINYDDSCFVFKDGNYYTSSVFVEWLRFHISVAFLYTGMLIMNEPSLSIFWEKFNLKSYGFVESLTIVLGILFGFMFAIGYAIKKIHEKYVIVGFLPET